MPLLRCPACARYTLQSACPACGATAASPAPAKFSPEDRYGAYRRRLKLLGRAKKETPP